MKVDHSQILVGNTKLLEETLNDFSTKPFSFASLNEIVKRAEFNKGSFYYRFRDKEDLYLAMIDLINAKHLVLYNHCILGLKKPHCPFGVAWSAFESLKQLHAEDHRYPFVLERFASEEAAFRETIRAQSLDFVFDRMIQDLTHAGCPISKRSASFHALNHLYHGVGLWPIEFRETDRLARMIEVIIANSTTNPPNKQTYEFKPDLLLDSNAPAGLTMVLGSRISGKSTISRVLFQDSLSQDQRAFLLQIERRRASQWVHGIESSMSFAKWARLGKRRWLQNKSTPDTWSGLLRLGDDPETLDEFRYVVYEILSRDPSRVIVDELFTSGKATDLAPILATFLKFSASGSTMILTSQIIETLFSSASRVAFLANGSILSVLDQETLRQRYPADRLVVRFLEWGIERFARLPFAETGLQAFRKDYPNATILDIRSERSDWHAIYKTETGEELT